MFHLFQVSLYELRNKSTQNISLRDIYNDVKPLGGLTIENNSLMYVAKNNFFIVIFSLTFSLNRNIFNSFYLTSSERLVSIVSYILCITGGS